MISSVCFSVCFNQNVCPNLSDLIGREMFYPKKVVLVDTISPNCLIRLVCVLSHLFIQFCFCLLFFVFYKYILT